jgi:hypothetical protein
MVDKKWKASNYDTNITVSQSAIDELKSRGTKEANIAYYKKHGATTEQREALNRFYGKGTISSSVIADSSAPNIRENRAQAPDPNRPNAREDRSSSVGTPKNTPPPKINAPGGRSGIGAGTPTPNRAAPGGRSGNPFGRSPIAPMNRSSSGSRQPAGLPTASIFGDPRAGNNVSNSRTGTLPSSPSAALQAGYKIKK